ncbi:MAG: uracil-DNA glycosylase [Anaerolineae bacterium]|nr:uracil-DNA glycosylase [Anaerolineae bacterium]
MPPSISKPDALRELQARLRACRLCPEAGYEVASLPVVSAGPAAEVILIGQAPGRTEAETGRPFHGPSGRRLFRWLETVGWEEEAFRPRHAFAAVTRCYPGPRPAGRGDRVPTRAEQALCRPYLDEELRLIAPRLIITLGSLALHLFYPASTRLSDVVGSVAHFPPSALLPPDAFDIEQAEQLDAFDPTQDVDGRWLVPLPHPSGASLWHNHGPNQERLQRALGIIGTIRSHLDL